MTPIWAITRLTIREGLRMRIVLVFVIAMVFIVLRLPFALTGDDTVAGRLQTFLDYSMSAVSILLSLATIFLACATLTSEFKTNTLHLVVTKPVTRFQVLVGKWLGIFLLNALLLVLCGFAIYGLALFIRERPETFRRDRLKVRDVLWTARAAAKPVTPDFRTTAEQDIQKRVEEGALANDERTRALAVRERIRTYESDWRIIRPNEAQVYEFQNLPEPERSDTALQVRFRAKSIPIAQDEVVRVGWVFLDPDTEGFLHEPFFTVERITDFHEFLINARSAVRAGRAKLLVINQFDPDNRYSIHFEGDDSLQIFYRVGGFEQNFVKALAILQMRLSFLAGVGLFFSTFVSFPIACMGAFLFILIGVGKPWWYESIGANIDVEFARATPSADPLGKYGIAIRMVLIPVLDFVFPDFSALNGVPKLVEGVNIDHQLVQRTTLHTLLFGIALLIGPGWLFFSRREVAEVQVQ
ncbi:MAG: ABC transporter permease [Phycisphaerales bacterium]|nr:ABC transporter permease [Phycisphaerales bacterium]